MSNEEKRVFSPGPADTSRPTLERAAYLDETMQDVHSQLMREKEEPREGFSPVPIFFIFLFGALMFWGGIYIAKFSGGFRSDVFDPDWMPTKTTEAVVAFDPLKQGKKLYAKTCQQCHQADGKGIPGVYPHLVQSSWVLGREDRLAHLLILGMSGPLEVDGQHFNGNMPPVGMWKDRDIAAVLTYIRQEWGNVAPAVSEDAVVAARKDIGKRSSPWNPAEILKAFP
jgi:mono/diheme cytochrome c family protein